jgi:capsular polysaccharide biosynthesis protein
VNLREYLIILNRKKGTIVSAVFIFLALASILTFIQPLKYEAVSKILVVQKFEPGVDPYNAAKANEYLSGILAKVISSNSFFDEIQKAGFNIDKSYFSDEPLKQAKKWRQTVFAHAESSSGVIAINVYHSDKYQLEQIARAVNYALLTKHQQYHGGGDSVVLRVVDNPVYSLYPMKPNVPFNFAAAFVLGFIFSLSYIYLFPEERYSLRFWPRSRAKRSDIRWIRDEEEVRKGYEMLREVNKEYEQESAPAQTPAPHREETTIKLAEPEKTRLPYNSIRQESTANNRWEPPIPGNNDAKPIKEDDLSYEDIISRGRISNVFGK